MPDRRPLYARGVLLDELELALDELPAEQREVFVAHEMEGRSFKEMAADSGVEREHIALAQTLCGAASAQRLQHIYDELMESMRGADHENRKKLIFIAPVAMLGMLLFIVFGGGDRAAAVELAVAVALRLGARSRSGRRSGFWRCAGSCSAALASAVRRAPTCVTGWRSAGSI